IELPRTAVELLAALRQLLQHLELGVGDQPRIEARLLRRVGRYLAGCLRFTIPRGASRGRRGVGGGSGLLADGRGLVLLLRNRRGRRYQALGALPEAAELQRQREGGAEDQGRQQTKTYLHVRPHLVPNGLPATASLPLHDGF